MKIINNNYLGKIIFRIGFARFYFKLMSVNIYLNKNSSTIAELF